VAAHILLGLLLPAAALRTIAALCRSAQTSARSAALLAAVVAASGILWLAAAFLGSPVRIILPIAQCHSWAAAALAVWACHRLLRRRTTPLHTAAAAMSLGAVSLIGAGYAAEAVYLQITSTSPREAANPHFPAALHTAGQFAPQQRCRDAGCHPAFAPAQISHTVRNAIETAQPPTQAWCRGCHAPATAAGVHETGIGCTACHTQSGAPLNTGGGAMLLAAPQPYPLSQTPGARLIRLRPKPHTASLALPPDDTACIPCHRQWSPPHLNGYRFQMLNDTWDTALNAPTAPLSIRRPGAEAKNCSGCHNPHTAHRGAAATPRKGALDLQFASLRRTSAGTTRSEILAPNYSPVVQPNDTLELDLLARADRYGHAVGGTDAQWLEVQVHNDKGKVIAREPAAEQHRLAQVTADAEGNPTTDKSRMALSLLHRRPAPNQPESARYTLQVPAGTTQLRLHAAWRRWQASGAIQTLAQTTLLLHVQGVGSADKIQARADDPAVVPLLLAHTEALLKQGDTTRARAQIRQAKALAPASHAVQSAAARACLADGDLLGAAKELEKMPPSPEKELLLGRTLRLQGQFEQAIDHLENALRTAPADRSALFESGRSLFQLGRFAEAAARFERLLTIDPLNPAAHLQWMQCLRRTAQTAAARREETLFRRLQPPPPPETLLRKAVRSAGLPEWETLPQHTHRLRSLP
jgi:tetratricopeptide (TPR) repeat protein